MRVVLDTNVLARAVRGKAGPASRLLDLLLTEQHTLIASEFLLDELVRVLRYPHVQRMNGLEDASLEAFAASIRDWSIVVNIRQGARRRGDRQRRRSRYCHGN
jgi:putative PIN family toxin of toxin-antitoxin system